MLQRLKHGWQDAWKPHHLDSCCSIDGVGSGETLIAWGPDTEVRPGDLVMLAHVLDDIPRTAYLRACRGPDGLRLQTRCGMPSFAVTPGQAAVSNGVVSATISGVLRGAYRCFGA